MAEVAALLAESQLARDEQERYLAVTRKMTEAPPMAWHRHVLDVEPSSGTRSLAGVVISRLKAWTTTPPVQRAAIVDAIVSKDAEVIAERLRSAKFWFESHLRDLKAGSTTTSAANVRERWQEYNAALTAAGQPPVMLPNEVLHAEQAERERAAKAELAKQENETTLQKCESRIEKTERQLRLYGDPRDPFLTYDPQKIERTYGEVRKVPQDMDPAEYRAALKRIFNRWFPYWEDLDKREQAANPTEVVPTLAPTPPPPPPLLLRVVHA